MSAVNFRCRCVDLETFEWGQNGMPPARFELDRHVVGEAFSNSNRGVIFAANYRFGVGAVASFFQVHQTLKEFDAMTATEFRKSVVPRCHVLAL